MSQSQTHVEHLRAMLDLASMRQGVIQRNLANINTPGFKSQEVKFDRELGKAMEADREGINPRQDGNTVVMEVEVAAMRKNALLYRMHLQALTHHTRLMRMAVSGRGQ